MRVTPRFGPFFAELEYCLQSYFLPELFGVEVSAAERQLFALPSRYGGLGLSNPVSISKHCFDSSMHSIAYLKDSILGSVTFELDALSNAVLSASQSDSKLRSQHFSAIFNELIGLFTPIQQRAIMRAKDCNSAWLSVIPLECHHFNLTSQEFRDALALRYRKPLLNLPPYCNGCGATFSVEHALDCCVGGLVSQRHNEARDAIGYLSSLVWKQVQKEPIVCESTTDDSTSETLIPDLRMRGV